MMDLLQSKPTLNLFQSILQVFDNLKQNICTSTLWICYEGSSEPLCINLQDTGTLLILQIQIQNLKGQLDLQITPETVLVSGERLGSPVTPNGLEPEFYVARFHSLIPLPRSIQPQTAITELNGATLTLTLMKSDKKQPTVNITVSDRSQLLPDVMAISAAPTAAELN